MNLPTALKANLKEAIGRAAGITGIYSRNFRSKMVIVTFHRVNDELHGAELTCDSKKFAEFCRFFRAYFRVIPLSEQIAGCSAGKDMGGTLSITFDDGYRDNCEIAAPILSGLGLPAAFFVTTGFIGSQIVAPWDRDLPLQPGWMDWDQVRALAANGFEIGCHTDMHIDMGTTDPQAIRADIEVAKHKLHRELGRPARLFAYPFGGREHITEQSRLLVREAGFTCCMSCCGGTNGRGADPFDLNRIPIVGWFAAPDQFGFELLTRRTAARA